MGVPVRCDEGDDNGSTEAGSPVVNKELLLSMDERLPAAVRRLADWTSDANLAPVKLRTSLKRSTASMSKSPSKSP